MKKPMIWLKRYAALFLCALLLCALVLPFAAKADDQKVVKVGWYESSFCTTDSSRRKSGYAYEYQLEIAAYSGWSYQYVTGSWTQLMDMLKKGELDLLSDVSYTEERAQKMLFPDLSMGTEEYYIFLAPGNTTISANDLSTLNGKKIGVNQGSIQVEMYQAWAAKHGVAAELIELTTSENESLNSLTAGELDAYITPNVHTDASRLVPLCKIGYSDFYFAVNKNRPDLLEDLNTALNRIQGENPYYNQRLFEKHVQTFGANAFLSASEQSWLAEHGKIRVGYRDNYLAFCAKDEQTGKLTGALKEFLSSAATCFVGTQLNFEAIAYPSTAAALEGMRNGEVDCVFPANFDGYESEERELEISPSLITTDVYAVIRSSEQKVFVNKDKVIVAAVKGNPTYDSLLNQSFPNWRAVYFDSVEECLEAVSESFADCILISNYSYNNIARLCERYRLTTYSTGVTWDYSFAVTRGNTELYSILAKAVGLVPDSTVNAALSFYATQDAKMTLGEFIAEYIWVLIAVIALVLLVIVFFLVRALRSERKAKKLILLTETDELTGLYNRNYFFEYADQIYRMQSGVARDAIVVNIEQFHSINALNGREFGDRVLRSLANEIDIIAKENGGISGRFGADRFDIYCKHRDDYQEIYSRLQKRLGELAPNASIRIRMGVMPWQPNLDPIQLFDRARTACNMARGHYRNHIVVFDEKIHEKEIFDQRLLNDLRHALDHYEFEVYYQPKYDVQGDAAKLIGAEALIRWRHPQLGMITPDNFIPLFEKSGMICEIDQYVWSQVARQLARWKGEFGITIPVSVNLSRIDVFDPTLEAALDGILRENGLEKSAINLEITESAYTENPTQVIRVVETLRKNGYAVEMDDFGTGYSSLNMLSEMPVDVLKMDRTFVRNIESSEKAVQLVALILDIANNLHIPVVAEGVETEGQLKILKSLGCTLAQGYYFSKPLHPTEFETKILQKQGPAENDTNKN